MKKSKSSYYFYDMEISKKHSNRNAIKDDEANNKAYKIIHQYHKLGLRTVEDINKIDYDAMTKMGVQLLVVLSRGAKNYWSEYVKKCTYTFEKCLGENEEFVLYKVKE